MPRNFTMSIGCVLACLALVSAAPASASRTARSCPLPEYPGSGYFTSLSVTRVSCGTGRSLALAHYRCRTQSGPRGRCTRRVRGYTCTERRTSIATEIDGRVTCRREGRRVVYSYQQNT
jgi:hypothetical protein